MGSSGASSSSSGPSASFPSSSTDNALVRWDGTGGDTLQSGLVIQTDPGALSGITQLDVDSLRLDSTTLSTTTTNADLTLAPHGSGSVIATGTALNLGGEGSSYASIYTAGSTGGELWATKNNGGNGGEIRTVNLYATSGTYSDSDQNKLTVYPQGDKIGFGSGMHLGWGSGTTVNRNPTLDTGMVRAAPGVVLDTNGAAGLGSCLTGRPVEASTAGSASPNILLATESRKLLTNEGATAEAYNTLPTSAPVGYEQAFYCQDADGIRITAPSGTTIRLGPGLVSASGGFVRSSTVGSGLVLIKINTAEFVCVVPPLGTWTIDL